MHRTSRCPIKANSIFLSLVSALLFVACSIDSNNLQRYRHIPANGWYADSLIVIPVQVVDTIARYDISVGLRYTDDYDYSNLWLFLTLVSSDGVSVVDTVNCQLADEYGRWYGTGIGASMQQRIPYKIGYRFPRSGTWHIAIQQGMREYCLMGVTDVGIKISEQ